MPARELYKLIFERIKDIAGICRFDEEMAPEWRNCPTHEPGTYGKGRAIGMEQFGFREQHKVNINKQCLEGLLK